jgi:hypothetical protein
MSFMQLAPVISAAWSGIISLGKSMITGAMQASVFTARILFQSSVLAGQFVFSLFSAATYTNLLAKAQLMAAWVSSTFTKALFVSGAAISMLKNRLATMSFAGFIGGMRAMAISAYQSSLSMVRSAIAGIGAWVSSLFAATAAQIGLNVAMTANPIGLIVTGIAALAGAVWLIVENWSVIKVWLIDLAAFVWKWSPFKLMLDMADALFPGLIGKLKEWGGILFTWLESLWGKLTELWDIIAPALGLGDISVKAEQIKLPEWKPNQDKAQGDFKTGLDLGGEKKKGGGGIASASNGVISGAGVQSATPKNITINIGSLVQGGITISSTTVGEGAAKIKDIIAEQLIRAVNDVNTIQN